MRAVRVISHGEPADVIEVQDIPAPDPGPGQVRVAVATAPLNFGDLARCRGGVASVTTEPPFTLGMEACGVVDAAGPGGEEWIGRRVLAMSVMSLGGMADYTLAQLTGVFDAPSELGDVDAAGVLLPFHTTYLALHTRARIQPGETLLITGAAGSLGTAAIQLGVAAGARVIAVAGGPDKVRVCRELGAQATIDHTTDDIFEAVMGHTANRGADVVVDLIGGPNTETIWSCVAYQGRYLPVGFNADPQSGFTGKPLRRVSMGNFSVLGVILAYNEESVPMRQFGVVPNPPEVGRQVHQAICSLVSDGSIRPYIGRRITADQVAAALQDEDQRRTLGRTVVDFTRPA
jgi:NADPH2:quinone reductase